MELGFVDQGYSRVKFLGHAIRGAMLRFYTGETGASRSKWYCRVPNDKCSWIWRADAARTADARGRLPSQLESNQAPRMVIRGRTATRVSVSRRLGARHDGPGSAREHPKTGSRRASAPAQRDQHR